MRRIFTLLPPVLLLVVSAPALSQPWDRPPPPPDRVPNLNVPGESTPTFSLRVDIANREACSL